MIFFVIYVWDYQMFIQKNMTFAFKNLPIKKLSCYKHNLSDKKLTNEFKREILITNFVYNKENT